MPIVKNTAGLRVNSQGRRAQAGISRPWEQGARVCICLRATEITLRAVPREEWEQMKKVKIAVIGAGGISHAHMGGYNQLSDVEIVAVADVLPGRAKEWAARYDVPHAFEDYQQLLPMPEIEGVSVCTYNRAHAQP